MRTWLGQVGEAVADAVGGTARLEFKRGHITVIDVNRSDTIERIGIRLDTYKGRLTLHHQRGGDVSDVDALDLPVFMRMTVRQTAEWAVSNTQGRAQVDLFRR